jgi:cation:H+ antiporter
MQIVFVLGQFLVGLVLLVAGGDLLVRGASRLAAALGISSLVIGLTVVAFGTSAPELAVSVQSAFRGYADIALGNVVGSNICNVLLILGLSALITPLAVSAQLVRFDVPLMIGISVLFLLLALDNTIGRLDGLLLFVGVITYTAWSIIQSRHQTQQAQAAQPTPPEAGSNPQHWLRNIIFMVAGLALLVLGADWLVASAVFIAEEVFNVPPLIVGLTVVAVGTSLPEVVTSVVASLRGERDIAVGNVVGSNIFNILSVLGLASIVAPAGISVPAAALQFDIPVMIAVAVACLPIFFTGGVIARWEGALFLGYYIAYTLYLILNATQHMLLPMFSTVMLLFVVPLTAITLLVLFVQAVRLRVHPPT